MKMFPVKKCVICGKYSDLEAICCPCGGNSFDCEIEVKDLDALSDDKRGIIDESIPLYYQICDYCKRYNFTVESEEKAMECIYCGKKRFTSNDRMQYYPNFLDGEASQAEAKNTPLDYSSDASQMNESDNDTIRILKAIQGYVENDDNKVRVFDERDNAEIDNINKLVSWNPILDVASSTLTLSIEGYSNSAKIYSEASSPIFIGRENWEFSDILERDLRVGRKHCKIYFENEKWYLVEIKAINRTKYNEKLVESSHGPVEIHDGGKISLGQNSDSFVINVRIS